MSDPPPADIGERVALVECDRFCVECGYNLRNQHVHRHAELGILLCRCPECGKVHTANEATSAGTQWLHRLVAVSLILWLLLVVLLCLGLTAAQFGLCVGTLEEMTRRVPTNSMTQPWVRVVRQPRDVILFLTVMRSCSLLSGAILMSIIVVACHHWRRWKYHAVAVCLPLIIGLTAAAVWRMDQAQLATWGYRMIAIASLFQFCGALIGVTFGRALARALARVVLPARLRAGVGFLWTADRLTPPMLNRS